MKTILPISILLALALSFGVSCDFSGHPIDKADDDDDDDDDNDAEECVDEDDDGWCEDQDCNDYDKSVHPGAHEDCLDLIDNDCDFFTDQDDPDCPEEPELDFSWSPGPY
jgi:Putative metal-binding motif